MKSCQACKIQCNSEHDPTEVKACFIESHFGASIQLTEDHPMPMVCDYLQLKTSLGFAKNAFSSSSIQ